MNVRDYDILKTVVLNHNISQRQLAESCGYSVGSTNHSLRKLTDEGYLNSFGDPTTKAMQLLEAGTPQNAIILAAGFGMRMVPINMEMPKGLLEIKGEPLIERLIKQLHEAGIRDIYVVVGFMKEQYEYLIDSFGVKLLVNPDYAHKNNLHSLKCASKYLSDSYIIPCDLWARENPFSKYELYSWYMVSDEKTTESMVRVDRKKELTMVRRNEPGNRMIGISYLSKAQAELVRERLEQFCSDGRYDDAFWEETLYDTGHINIAAKMVRADAVVEIDTYEQLRELDHGSAQLQNHPISTIANVMNARPEEIVDIEVLKKGMTNRSFLFSCKGEKYIMRIPGEGTDRLINRNEEAEVYRRIADRALCDDIVYVNPRNGYKITRFFENARVCDSSNTEDLRKCMKKLREFHSLGLQVEHEFDFFRQIAFYESLWDGAKSVYRDYQATKENVLSLKSYIDKHKMPYVLTHIDAVPDNFLFIKNGEGKEEIRLIDWEYAGMQDPHVDVAMFCIYSLYDREEVDELIDLYFENNCTHETRIKIYCYIACCGLLWSNWCEYKRLLGVEFGEYSLRQYRYAKDYYRIVQKEMEERKM